MFLLFSLQREKQFSLSLSLSFLMGCIIKRVRENRSGKWINANAAAAAAVAIRSQYGKSEKKCRLGETKEATEEDRPTSGNFEVTIAELN